MCTTSTLLVRRIIIMPKPLLLLRIHNCRHPLLKLSQLLLKTSKHNCWPRFLTTSCDRMCIFNQKSLLKYTTLSFIGKFIQKQLRIQLIISIRAVHWPTPRYPKNHQIQSTSSSSSSSRSAPLRSLYDLSAEPGFYLLLLFIRFPRGEPFLVA